MIDHELLSPILASRIKSHALQNGNWIQATDRFANLNAVLSEPLQVFANAFEDVVRDLHEGTQVGNFGSQLGDLDLQRFMRFESWCQFRFLLRH